MSDDPTLLDSRHDTDHTAPSAGDTAATNDAQEPRRQAATSAFTPRSSQWETLEHMERLLAEIRGALDAAARDAEHRPFSIAATVGAILQVVVGGLVVLSLVDWALGASAPTIMLKLAFAAVFQLATLTAFVVARGR